MNSLTIKKIANFPSVRCALLSTSVLLMSCTTMPGQSTSNLRCEGVAEYKLTFVSTWSAETHPESFPPDPHYSKLVGATHQTYGQVWSLGQLATTGVKDIAEQGLNVKFRKEIDWAIKIDEAGSYIDGPDMKLSPGQIGTRFTVTPDFPLVSVLSMIAPSPDWVVGVSGLNMCENATWVLEKALTLRAFDVGTDAGTTYVATNQPETEKQKVQILQSNMDSEGEEVPAFGELRFELVH
jgi:hypothetical protein